MQLKYNTTTTNAISCDVVIKGLPDYPWYRPVGAHQAYSPDGLMANAQTTVLVNVSSTNWTSVGTGMWHIASMAVSNSTGMSTGDYITLTWRDPMRVYFNANYSWDVTKIAMSLPSQDNLWFWTFPYLASLLEWDERKAVISGTTHTIGSGSSYGPIRYQWFGSSTSSWAAAVAVAQTNVVSTSYTGNAHQYMWGTYNGSTWSCSASACQISGVVVNITFGSTNVFIQHDYTIYAGFRQPNLAAPYFSNYNDNGTGYIEGQRYRAELDINNSTAATATNLTTLGALTFPATCPEPTGTNKYVEGYELYRYDVLVDWRDGLVYK
jgi:hypothetical protein